MTTRLLLSAALVSAGLLASCAPGPRAATGTPSWRGVAVVQDFIPDGRYGRQLKLPLRPTFITVHSTQSVNGTAAAHASLLKRGGIPATTQWNRHRWNIWHFTVDDRGAIQHMPLTEQGEHADHEGPGNTNSIGIEMCEFSSPARQAATIENTRRLVASLAAHYGIPRANIVPHYHWPMRPNGWHKDCPRILLEHGRPGPRWERFLDSVDRLR